MLLHWRGLEEEGARRIRPWEEIRRTSRRGCGQGEKGSSSCGEPLCVGRGWGKAHGGSYGREAQGAAEKCKGMRRDGALRRRRRLSAVRGKMRRRTSACREEQRRRRTFDGRKRRRRRRRSSPCVLGGVQAGEGRDKEEDGWD